MPEASTSMAFTASTSASATVIATAASGKTALDLEMTDLQDKDCQCTSTSGPSNRSQQALMKKKTQNDPATEVTHLFGVGTVTLGVRSRSTSMARRLHRAPTE